MKRLKYKTSKALGFVMWKEVFEALMLIDQNHVELKHIHCPTARQFSN